MLKAIEAQHGLLIERADELWSFSHLTFQEYFTVKWLTDLDSQQLADKITSQRWQGVVKQLMKSQQPADRLLCLIKQAIDQFVSQETAVQTFLNWLLQKSNSSQANCKPAGIRASYYSLARVCAFEVAHNLEDSLSYALVHALDLDSAFEIYTNRISNCNINVDGAIISNLYSSHYSSCLYALSHSLDHSIELALDLNGSLNNDFELARSISPKYSFKLFADLTVRLRKLKNELSILNYSTEIQHWWPTNGNQWIEHLRETITDYRNSSYDWKFTEKEKKQLRQHYAVNKFLIDLMKVKGAVSENCRVKIEKELLLPWTELQQ